jgi:hypothetical protein
MSENPQGAWQPIDTAPEGRVILLRVVEFGVATVISGCLIGDRWDVPALNVHGCGCCSIGEKVYPDAWMELPEGSVREGEKDW